MDRSRHSRRVWQPRCALALAAWVVAVCAAMHCGASRTLGQAASADVPPWAEGVRLSRLPEIDAVLEEYGPPRDQWHELPPPEEAYPPLESFPSDDFPSPSDLPGEPAAFGPAEADAFGEFPAEAAPDEHAHDGYGYGDLQYGLWGWLSYIAHPQDDWYTFWAWEAEFDVTKSFSETIAASADIDFEDTNRAAEVNIEQLFLSVLLPHWNDAIFTAGKFNAPFGVERRDFWDRVTGSPSLLWRAKPRDLTGLMLTQPFGESGVTIRPFVVNGFDHNLDINQEPSCGAMVQYQPCEALCLAVTNWWGPEFENNNGDKLFFTDAQITWIVDCRVTVWGEFLYGASESPWGRLNWVGGLVIATYTFNERWRLFVQGSTLDDEDAFHDDVALLRGQGSVGFSWFWHPLVESRFEYRRDFDRELWTDIDREFDRISAHLVFGY